MTVIAASTVANTVAIAIVAALNALSSTLYPEFNEITWGTPSSGAFTATGKTLGVPFTLTLTTTETGGGAADAQTFTQAATTAANGGTFWSTAANWSTGAVPVAADDVVFQNSANSCLDGLAQDAVTLTSLTIDQSYTGTIGRPRVNPLGYTEYRATYLAVSATTITIGRGDGAGSGRIKINTGTVQTALNIINTGTPTESGVKSVLWLGTHASNALVIGKGSFAAANYAGEVSTILTLKEGYQTSIQSDSDVRIGSGVGTGVTIATITKTGGTLEINNAFTTLTQTDGETIHNAGAGATVAVTGGTLRVKTAGTYTTPSVGNKGTIDCSQDLQARTFTSLTVNAGGTLLDKGKTVTFTNPIVLTCPLDKCVLDLGNSLSLQRS